MYNYRRNFKILFVLLLIVLSVKDVIASHLRAGEITAERISSLTYKFTLTLYINTGGLTDQPTAILKFGYGSPEEQEEKAFEPFPLNLGNNTQQNIYIFTHIFPGPGSYDVSFWAENRNGGVRNMDDSYNTAFYISTTINTQVGSNSTPQLLVPPIDIAASGQLFIHNPGAWDPDGDSLSYRLTIPRKAKDVYVNNYKDPADPGFFLLPDCPSAGTATFTLDPVTGDIVWDTPCKTGEYNIAFYIEEWRNGLKLSSTIRDMQIFVEECTNNRPMLEIPKDICVIAGDIINDTIKATDIDGDIIQLYGYSGIFNLSSSPAIFTPASGSFTWQTSCGHVRDQPYQVTFKAEDVSVCKLVDIRNWFITVKAPAPTGLSAIANNKSITLSWDFYPCNNAQKMGIWRRTGNYDFDPDSCCEINVPDPGYQKIAEVAIYDTTFVDDDNGIGLKKGPNYCYLIAAEFPKPGGGISCADTICQHLVLDVPVITNVSVINTDLSNGEIEVKWVKPLEIADTIYPPPYHYKLYRAKGQYGSDYTLIYTLIDTAGAITDTSFLDSGLNTQDSAYNYKVEFYYKDTTFKGVSDSASSVWLNTVPACRKVQLSWKANVPWSNIERYHYIYKMIGTFQLVDSVLVTEDVGSYIDSGLINGDSAWYYIKTNGTYGMPLLPDPLINASQITFEIPRDTNPPLSPILYISQPDCDLICKHIDAFIPPNNEIFWKDNNLECENNISTYKVYQSCDGVFKNIDSTKNDTSFSDISIARCYVVTAIDIYGNESEFSNKVCTYNCLCFPNIFTPNNDKNKLNEIFSPKKPVPKEINSVKLDIYNRWGKRVFYKVFNVSTGDVDIEWDGRANNKRALPDGVYYYHAEVEYRCIDENVTFKGWVQILR
ncbi:MAG: T9SS type B sorting domain-containing protein [Cytophagales bacterium]|nr:T9SS type B sorting domain-containing protein [Cytophagales bacterium]